MDSFAHAAVGISLGVLSREHWVTILFGTFSHAIMDSVPHYDFVGASFRKRFGQKIMLIAEILSIIAIMGIAIYLRPAYAFWVIWGGFWACMLDIDKVISYYFPYFIPKIPSPYREQGLHFWFHSQDTSKGMAFGQVVIAIVALLSIVWWV